MNDQNKTIIRAWLAKVGLAVYLILTIATCAGVWNFCQETAVKVMAGAVLLCNVFIVVKLWKKSTPQVNGSNVKAKK